MTILQFALNVIFGLLAFALARYLLAYIAFDGAIGWLISVLVGVVVFFANFAARLRV